MKSSTKAVSVMLTFAIVFAGCGNKNSQQAGDIASSSRALPVASIEAGLKAVPASAIGVMTIASPQSFWELLVNQSFFPVSAKAAAELNAAMIAHVDKHLGLDLSNVQSIVGYAVEDGGAAILSPVAGTLKGATETDGVATLDLGLGKGLIVAKYKDTLVVGKTQAVGVSLGLLKGEGDAFAGDFASFAQAQRKGSYFSLSARLDKLPLPPMPFTKGLTRGAFKVGDKGIRLQIEGEKETLELLKGELDNFVQMALAGLKSEMDANQDDFIPGAAAILGYYNGKGLAKTIDPKIEGSTMTIELDLFNGGGSAMIIVSVVGILAAVAIPAFMTYMKRSKTTEAVVFLKNMSNSARMYYAMPEFGGSLSVSATVTAKTFPASVGPTPPLRSCCANGETCVPDPNLWNHPTWKALDFAMLDPHKYSYAFTRADDGMSYTALAYGDLDCDGEYSTFSLYGQVIDGEVQTAGDLVKVNPLE